METSETVVESVEGAAPPPAIPKKQRGDRDRVDAAIDMRDAREALSVVDWLRDQGDVGDYKLSLYRKSPDQWMGTPITGYIETFTDRVTEEELKQKHGGGTYQLKLSTMDPKGMYKFRAAHTFRIAGDPKPDAQIATKGSRPTEEPASIQMKAMEVMQKEVERAHNMPRGGGMDGDALARSIAAAQAPLLQTIEMLKNELAAARADATAARNVPPDPVRDQILQKVMQDDTTRTTSLRAAHDAEVGALKTEIMALESRWRDKLERESDRLIRQYEGQMTMMKTSYETQIATLKSTYENQITMVNAAHTGQLSSLKESHAREISSQTLVASTKDTVGQGELNRLRQENSDLKAENKDLRAKKDKPLLEQIKEIDELKEIMGGGDEDKPGWERALDVVMNAGPAMELVKKWTGAGPTPGGQPPPHVPFVGQDGQTYVHDGQGNVTLVQPASQAKQRLKARRRAQMQAAQAAAHAAANPPPPPPAPPPPDAPPEVQAQHAQEKAAHEEAQRAHAEALFAHQASQIPMEMIGPAVIYLEHAFRNNQEPVTVAQSLRSQGFVPDAVFQFLRDQGVDALLEKVARLEASSPLATQAGRNWVRKVAKGLLGDT